MILWTLDDIYAAVLSAFYTTAVIAQHLFLSLKLYLHLLTFCALNITFLKMFHHKRNVSNVKIRCHVSTSAARWIFSSTILFTLSPHSLTSLCCWPPCKDWPREKIKKQRYEGKVHTKGKISEQVQAVGDCSDLSRVLAEISSCSSHSLPPLTLAFTLFHWLISSCQSSQDSQHFS